MRSWKSEALSVATVLALPALLAFMLPYEALTFRANAASPHAGKSFAKLISLNEAEFAAATVVAKSPRASRDAVGTAVRFKIGELPQAPMSSVAIENHRAAPPPVPPPALDPVPYLPSAAALPVVLPSPGAVRPFARSFTREQLLESPW